MLHLNLCLCPMHILELEFRADVNTTVPVLGSHLGPLLKQQLLFIIVATSPVNCVWAFCLHICLCTPCVWCLERQEEDIASLETGVTNGYLPWCGCWELRHGSVVKSQCWASSLLLQCTLCFLQSCWFCFKSCMKTNLLYCLEWSCRIKFTSFGKEDIRWC